MDANPAQGLISLAYSGREASLAEIALKDLEEFNLSATFLLESTLAVEYADTWKRAAYSGHEFGSQSLYGYADPRGNLPNWTLEMVEEDLRMSRKLLAELFPEQLDFPFGYPPGGETGCVTYPYDPQPTSYRPVVERVFEVSIASLGGFNSATASRHYLLSLPTEGATGSEIRAAVDESIERGAWAIFVIEGVGAGPAGMDSRAHRELLHRLTQDDVKVLPIQKAVRQWLQPAF